MTLSLQLKSMLIYASEYVCFEPVSCMALAIVKTKARFSSSDSAETNDLHSPPNLEN